MNNNYAIFILSNGRADNVQTHDTLRKMNVKSKIYIVVDDMDEQIETYKKNYNNVLVFDKKNVDADTMINKEIWQTPLYARNKIIEYAKDFGYDYILMIDDDITDFKIRKEREGKLKAYDISDFDSIINAMIEYMENTPITFLGFVTSAAYIGGANGAYQQKIKRDISQAFVCKVNSCPRFRGVMNEDYLASLDVALNCNIAASIFDVMLIAPVRMSNKGGLHDTYKSMNIYVRDFYTCMAYPSTGVFHDDLVYKRQKKLTFPMIISDRYKK